MKQRYTSARTCRYQIPALHRRLNWVSGEVNADIGGGKWDLTTEFLAELGVVNVIYDQFNRDPDWNEKALARIKQGCLTATVSNVLNVIAEAEVRREVIELARYAQRAYFSVYEGDGTGVGKETRCGWQENRKLKDYLSEVQLVFPCVTLGRGFIRADHGG